MFFLHWLKVDQFELSLLTGTMTECLVVTGALSTATAEKLASGIRSRSKKELFCTVIAPEMESTLKLTLWSPINAYVTLPNMPRCE